MRSIKTQADGQTIIRTGKRRDVWCDACGRLVASLFRSSDPIPSCDCRS